MKRIAILLGLILLIQSCAFADEILDSQGNIQNAK